MSRMKRNEAMNELLTMLAKYAFDADEAQAVGKALEAIRPVSRERIEKVWRGEWIDTNHRTSSCKCTKCGAVQEYETPFCPACGAPMTDEAVDMMMERLEALESDARGTI